MSSAEKDIVKRIRLQDVHVRLSDISKSAYFTALNPPPARADKKIRRSSVSALSPGSNNSKITNYFQVVSSGSDSSKSTFLTSASKMERGNSPGPNSFSASKVHRIRLKNTARQSDNKENVVGAENSLNDMSEAALETSNESNEEDVTIIDDFLPHVGGQKVQNLTSPNKFIKHYEPVRSSNESQKRENRTESRGILVDDEDSKTESRGRKKALSVLHRISPAKKRAKSKSKSNERCSPTVSPISGKTYRRSSLMSLLLEKDSGAEDEALTKKPDPHTEIVIDDEKDEEDAIVKENTDNSQDNVNDREAKEDLPTNQKVTEKKKKKVHFALDDEESVEEMMESEVESCPVVDDPVVAPELGILRVVWARIGGHPWWPAIVCKDPELQVFCRIKQRQGGKQYTEINVSFFGENSRAWLDEKNVRAFEGLEEFEKFKTEVLKHVTGKANKKLAKAFRPSSNMDEKWKRSVEGAEKVRMLPAEERMENMRLINQEMSAKKKRKLSVEVDDGRVQTEAKKQKLDEESEGGEALRRGGGATRRQQDVKLRQEEREKKEKEKGPGWYYELVPVVAASAEPEQQKLGQFVAGRCCLSCEEAGGQVWRCRGCQRHYHPACEGADTASCQAETFRCSQCLTGAQQCLLCHEVTRDGEAARRCSVSGCGKSYHAACLSRYTIWPQVRTKNGNIYCPDHTCHTCASDNPKDPVMKYNEKLMHCTRCPTAYHAGDHCVAAGTIQITKTDIICPKHYTAAGVAGNKSAKSKKSSSTSHVNTNWCFICSKGGSLLCCEKCPASFHEECLGLTEPLQDKYFCEDCQSGRLPLYNDIVWAKWGAFRWWPALVLHPSNVPDNIEKVKHQDGEFPIKFLGSGDYNWINHGRTFFYEEGDSQKVPSLSNSKSMDATFRRGLAEAEELYRELREARLNRERQNCLKTVGSKMKSGNMPQYVKIKNNKPYGNCPTYSADPEEGQPCDCDKGKDRENPCGEESNCMNRLLMFECQPSVCPVKDTCNNMRFQKRQYPSLECFRTVEGRGWGLRSSETIKKGQFVIEYVGELITMEEYRNRMAADQLAGQENYYYLTIDRDRMIDAGPKGNLARFMNHSCDPNCITQKWTVNGDTRVGLFAIKDVGPGTELTFNYQFETVGDDKKKCMCGAANCSGLIGEKPQNKEKEEKKVAKMSKDKKKKKKKKSTKARSPQLPELLGERGRVSPERVVAMARHEKEWEEFCFRCGEPGNLLPCHSGRCPKAYHPACLGRSSWPAGAWVCPWHQCAHCPAPAQLWCRHCPTAVCADHSDAVSLHPVLGRVCNQHGEDDLQFLIKLVEKQGLAFSLPCPSPSQEQLRAWRAARGVEEGKRGFSATPSLSLQSSQNRRFSLGPDQRPQTKIRDVTNIEVGDVTANVLRERFQVRLNSVIGVEEEADCEVTETPMDSENHQKVTGLGSGRRLSLPASVVLSGQPRTLPTKTNAARLQEKTLNISVPIFQSSSPNTSFSKKGYEGPYYCLSEGCGFVLEEFGLATQKKLVNHWSSVHGDIKMMLYYDQHSHSVLNLKVILNNVGYCNSPGCDTVLFSSRKTDFAANVNTHWRKAHPEKDIKGTNLVNIVCTVTEISQDQAVNLVKKLPIYSGKSLQVLNSEIKNNVTAGRKKKEEVEIQEESLHDDAESDEEEFGPFKCSRCDFQQEMSVKSSRLVLNHWISNHDESPRSLQFIDVPTGRNLFARHFFKTIGKCRSCEHIIGNNGRDSALFRRVRAHWAERHADLADTADTDKVELIDIGGDDVVTRNKPEKARREALQLRCSECDLVMSLSGSSSQRVLQHWAKHSLHLATLRMVRTSDQLVLNIKHLFRWIYRCRATRCNYMAVSNVSAREAEGKVREHWARSHNTACPAQLEEAPHLGYKCCLCHKVLLELTEFRDHLADSHSAEELDSDLFLTDLETGAEVALESINSQLPASQQTDEVTTTVLQCPAVLKGGKQCPELAMDKISLMTHWGCQHVTNGSEFSPVEVNILSVTHYQCPVLACPFRHLSSHSVRKHWDTQHKDQSDKFIVIKHSLGAAPGLQETTRRKRENSSSDSSQAAAKKKKFDSDV